jgi:YVTN family beta-propeller protein
MSGVAAIALALLGWLFWPVSPVGVCAPEGTSRGDPGAAREVAALPVGAVPTHIVPSADGRRVYVLDTYGVWAVDPLRNAIVGHYGGPGTHVSPQRVAVSPDGTRLYVTLTDTLAVLDAATMTRLASAPVGGASPTGVAVSTDGRHVWVGHDGAGLETDQDNAVTVLDADSLARVDMVPVGGARPDVLTIAAHDQRLYVGGLGGQTHVIDMSRRQVVAEIDYSDSEGMVLAPNGICGYLATAMYENNDTRTKPWNIPNPGGLAVLDMRTLRWLDSLPRDDPWWPSPRVVAVSPKSRYLFGITGQFGINGLRTDHLQVIDTATWHVVARIGVSTEVRHIAVSPDGRRVYLTSATSNALLTVDVSPYA